MNKNTMILIAVAITIFLIIFTIVLFLLLRKKAVFAERIYVSSSITNQPVSSELPLPQISFERIEVFNMKDINILKDITNMTGHVINLSLGGEQQIKRIIVRNISADSTISLYKLNGESPFSYTFTTATAFKEFNF